MFNAPLYILQFEIKVFKIGGTLAWKHTHKIEYSDGQHNSSNGQII